MKNASHSYSLPPTLRDRIREIAEKQNMTQSALVERILQEAVDQYDNVKSAFDDMSIFQLIDAISEQTMKRKKKK